MTEIAGVVVFLGVLLWRGNRRLGFAAALWVVLYYLQVRKGLLVIAFAASSPALGLDVAPGSVVYLALLAGTGVTALGWLGRHRLRRLPLALRLGSRYTGRRNRAVG